MSVDVMSVDEVGPEIARASIKSVKILVSP